MKQESWLHAQRSLRESGGLSHGVQISWSPMNERLDPDHLGN
ncbi:MAG TPA: hypothetical protein V6D20_11390 [Candidatus Obscuribacterales bacterium]